MDVKPCAIKIGEKYPLIAVGCPNDRVYLYKFTRKDSIFTT